MQTSNLHLKCENGATLQTLTAWLGKGAPTTFEVIPEQQGWSTILLGGYSLERCPVEDWLRLSPDLLFESFSTSLGSGELIYIAGGKLVRHLVLDDEETGASIDIGSLQYEQENLLKTWSDIWTFVEDEHWRDEVAV